MPAPLFDMQSMQSGSISTPMEDSDDYQQSRRRNRRDDYRGGFISPFRSMFGDTFGDPFGDFMGIGSHFQRQMEAFSDAFKKMDNFMQSDPAMIPQDGTSYFCSSSTTTMLPNGVVETKRHTRTNDREQKEHYRQLGEKRVVSKVDKDLLSGREDIRRDLYNVKEDELDQFERDFTDHRTRFDDQWGGRYLGMADRDTKPRLPLKHREEKPQKSAKQTK